MSDDVQPEMIAPAETSAVEPTPAPEAAAPSASEAEPAGDRSSQQPTNPEGRPQGQRPQGPEGEERPTRPPRPDSRGGGEGRGGRGDRPQAIVRKATVAPVVTVVKAATPVPVAAGPSKWLPRSSWKN